VGTTVETWPKSRSYGGDPSEVAFTKTASGVQRAQATGQVPAGRWPANVVLTHAEACGDECADGCPVAELDQQSGTSKSKPADRGAGTGDTGTIGGYGGHAGRVRGDDDEGGASRFFPVSRYQAKAPARERPEIDGKGWPTVKPLELMRWLVRLVPPPGG